MRARARRIFEDGGEILPSLRPSFCGAHDRMYIFDPFGDIYACWERTGDREVRIGSVTPEGDVLFRTDPLKLWHGRTVASNPVCRRCPLTSSHMPRFETSGTSSGVTSQGPAGLNVSADLPLAH